MEYQPPHRGGREKGARELNAAPATTICAVATATGRGGVGIVRLSGPRTREIGARLLGKNIPTPRRATLARFLDAEGGLLDEGLALFFAAPHSYTGEDVLELHAHGGPILLEAIVSSAITLGAVRAAPGEFTQRAFLNDKLDLAQAEAVADLIDAGSLAAARAAQRSLQGEFSRRVQALVEALTTLRVWVEAAIDFPEEEIDFLADQNLHQQLTTLRQQFSDLLATTRQGTLLRDGMTVVIAGRPNAGKSSLLNVLAGREAAIVTDIPGTTRDVIKEYLSIDGMPLHVLDTAGLRQADDTVEAEGIRRARAEIARADRVLFVIDLQQDPTGVAWQEEAAHLPPTLAVTLIGNKCDVLPSGIATALNALADPRTGAAEPLLPVSAKTGEGIDVLREHLKTCMGYELAGEGSLSARARHLETLHIASNHVESAISLLTDRRAGELAAEELRLAQIALGEMTGAVHSDELLGRIFASFCIGK